METFCYVKSSEMWNFQFFFEKSQKKALSVDLHNKMYKKRIVPHKKFYNIKTKKIAKKLHLERTFLGP